MFSVVLPTLWRAPQLERMLPFINGHPLVSEICLINNDYSRTPDWFRSRSWDKIDHVNVGKNLYVNPSWEIGISRSSNDNICLYSDDVLFDTKVFDFLDTRLTPESGCVGPDALSIQGMMLGDRIGLLDIIRPCFGYGTLLFLNKYNYVPIPKEFKIFYGDTWIFKTHLEARKIPRSLVNFRISTRLETTSGSKEFAAQTELEHKVYKEKYNWDLS